MKKIIIKAPATSANLGSGFDCAGIALELYNTFEFEKIEKGLIIEGCDKKYVNENNLAYVAYKAVCDKIGANSSVKITTSEICVPVSRGLGSSATLICAGAYAANALFGKKLSDNEVLKICNDIEGHPDNVAPALFGSLCVSVSDFGKLKTIKFPISENLHFIALIPNFRVETKYARFVLPKQVNRADAVYNMSRTALLPYAFSNGDFELIKLVTQDRIHEQYRKKLFRNVSEVEKICYSCGALTFNISGAGSACLCIAAKDISSDIKKRIKHLDNGWQAVGLKVADDGIKEVYADEE